MTTAPALIPANAGIQSLMKIVPTVIPANAGIQLTNFHYLSTRRRYLHGLNYFLVTGTPA